LAEKSILISCFECGIGIGAKIMQKLDLKTEIGVGKDTEISLLSDDQRRKIIQITLRNNAELKAHVSKEPITIHCVVGKGSLVNVTNRESFDLSSGVLITVEAEILHEVKASPEVSFLLIKYKDNRGL